MFPLQLRSSSVISCCLKLPTGAELGNKPDKNIFDFQDTSQNPKGWDFILNWMSDRVGQKTRNNTGNHRDDSNEDIEKAEKQFYENEETSCHKESYKNQVAKNWEIIDDHVSFKFVDESKEVFQPLEVKDLADMLVPLPGQGDVGQVKKYTDI